MSSLSRAQEGVAVAIALNRIENPQSFLESARIEVGAKKPETLIAVLVYETIDGSLGFKLRLHRIPDYQRLGSSGKGKRPQGWNVTASRVDIPMGRHTLATDALPLMRNVPPLRRVTQAFLASTMLTGLFVG
ncbi:MAG TPA: hypothetical protein VLK65_01685 [Vicinamibacteria bacterium]|nr:hypothetical protein [Vicinamibacteria bacterium]